MFYMIFALVLIYSILFFSMFTGNSTSSRIVSWVVSTAGVIISETGIAFAKNMIIPVCQVVVLQWSCPVIVGTTNKEEICGPAWQESLKQALCAMIILLLALLCWLIGSVSVDSSPFSKSGLKSPIRTNLIEDLLIPFAAVMINTSGYPKWRPINLFLITGGGMYNIWHNMKVPAAYDLKIQNLIFLVDTCASWCYLYSAVIYVGIR